MKTIAFKPVLSGLAIVFLILTGITFKAAAQALSEEEQAYVKVTNERADKIVATLGIADSDKSLRVRDIIAQQYRDLSGIQDTRDAAIAVAEEQANGEEAAAAAGIEKLKKKADKKIARLHKQYIKKLSAELNQEQVDQVKDGMTYGVAPLTYKAFQDMLPSLTEEQKATIWDYLVEAREKAMDGGSSEEKHHIFGDYKGKINNYLSAQGYDLKKASKDWQKRREAAKNN